MRETWVQSLDPEDPLEKKMATHSSILAWRIPWTEEPGGLQSVGSQRVGHDWATSLSLSQSLALRPAAFSSPGSLLEMQIPPVLLLDQFCKVRNSGDEVKQAPGDSDGRWRPASALSCSSHWHCSFSVNFQKGSRLYEVSCCHLYVKSEVAEWFLSVPHLLSRESENESS